MRYCFINQFIHFVNSFTSLICFFNCSQHTLVKKRHETLLKAFGCLEQYKQCRLKFTKYCIGKGSKIPISKISKFSTQPNPTKICPLSIKSINSNMKNNIINIEYYQEDDTIRKETENPVIYNQKQKVRKQDIFA